SIANISERRELPASIARLNGRPAAILSIIRDEDTSLFRFDAGVRAVLRSHRRVEIDEVWNDASELRIVLWRLLIAMAIASTVVAICGVRYAFYIPIASAIVINVLRIAAMRVNAHTLLVAAAAMSV